MTEVFVLKGIKRGFSSAIESGLARLGVFQMCVSNGGCLRISNRGRMQIETQRVNLIPRATCDPARD